MYKTIIPNENTYYYEKKYISIHSEDRDILKYPNSSEFEIELPQDYINVASARLYSWSFPENYSIFSVFNNNLSITFQFINDQYGSIYNPGDYVDSGAPGTGTLADLYFNALFNNLSNTYEVSIEPGYYTAQQMITELTNKMNTAVTNNIILFWQENKSEYPTITDSNTISYTRFVVAYNNVSEKIWFGNQSDHFIILNDVQLEEKNITNTTCLRKNILPQSSAYGLSYNLGFTPCNVSSKQPNFFIENNTIESLSINSSVNPPAPTFFYNNTGSTSQWIQLDNSLPNSSLYILQTPYKININGPLYLFMEISGMNCIDETSPYNISEFTLHTNKTNSVVNSAFAKIPVPTPTNQQFYDKDQTPYKYFYPPAERIRKLNIKFRFHNGQLVPFGLFNYSFMLEFNILRPQQNTQYNIKDAFNLSQTQKSINQII